MKSEQKHIYWLDIIRFSAAFLVLLEHTRYHFLVAFDELPVVQQTPLVALFYTFTHLGHASVLVFFVLSGFLVGGKTIERIKDGKFNLPSYVIDRSVRIMLPLISALLLIWITNVIVGDETNYKALIGNFFSMQGVIVDPVSPPLWSLSYEVWFYVIMGGIALFFSTLSIKRKVLAFGYLLIGCLVFVKLLFVYLAIWFLGAFTYFIIPPKKSILLFVFSILIFVFMLIPMVLTDSAKAEEYVFLNRQVVELVFGFSICVFFQQLLTFKPQNLFMRKVDHLGTKLAAFSYTLYLTHTPIVVLLRHWGFAVRDQINAMFVCQYIVGVIISLIAGYFIYWMFEKRTGMVKMYIRKFIK